MNNSLTSELVRTPIVRWAPYFSVLPYALLAACVLAATSFTFLQTDDFCTFGRVTNRAGLNPLLDVQTLYMQWTGRYSASGLVALVAALSGLTTPTLVYPLALAVFLFLFGYACVAISRLVAVAHRPNPVLALVMFCSTLLLMPSKLEQYLWLTGAAVYFVGAALVLLLAYRLGVESEENPPVLRGEIPIIVLAVLATGFNEFLALVVGACLAWSALRDMSGGQRQRWRLHGARLALFLAALAATVFAPGNFARDAANALPRHDVVGASAMMFQSLGVFAKGFFVESGLAFMASLTAAFSAGWLVPSGGASHKRGATPFVVILIGAFPMHLWVYSFLTGEATPGRVINQAFTLAQIALCLIASWVGSRARAGSDNPRIAASAVLSLAGLVTLFSPTSREFVTTLRDFGPMWRAQQVERHSGLAGITTRQPVYLRPFATGDSSPPIFAGSDISSDPSHWINRCVADYYGVESVILMRRSY